MGVAGWRFAHVKRNLSGRAAIVAVLEDWQVICSAVVAAGSMNHARVDALQGLAAVSAKQDYDPGGARCPHLAECDFLLAFSILLTISRAVPLRRL